MLTNTLKLQHEQIESIAASWLAAGAQSLSIWSGGMMLMQWPDNIPTPSTDMPTISAPLFSGDLVLAELRVTGLHDDYARQRLHTDAALMAHLIRLEDELEDMTAELIESQDQLLALYDLTQSTRSHLDMPETLRSMARVTARLVNVQASCLIFHSAQYTEIISHPVELLNADELFSIFQRVQADEQEVIWNTPYAARHLPEGVHNMCLVPIEVRGTIMAALGLINSPYGFTSPDLQLVRAIAGQAGARLENLLLHQETLAQAKLQTEMDLATQAQLNLLPSHPPTVRGLDIYAESRPALDVGGDFYDFIYQQGRPFIFSVGDVAGKGMSAALLMAMTRTAIRSKANFMPRATPEMIMNRSNDDLSGDFAMVRKFATVFVGQYEPAQRRLLYTNAGHSPVIYCPSNGRAQLLEANGSAMGIFYLNPYNSRMLDMQPGDVLVVATDGFSEARSIYNQMFGFERLIALTETLTHLSARDIALAWYDAVSSFETGFSQDDDRTLIVIKVQPFDNLDT